MTLTDTQRKELIALANAVRLQHLALAAKVAEYDLLYALHLTDLGGIVGDTGICLKCGALHKVEAPCEKCKEPSL